MYQKVPKIDYYNGKCKNIIEKYAQTSNIDCWALKLVIWRIVYLKPVLTLGNIYQVMFSKTAKIL